MNVTQELGVYIWSIGYSTDNLFKNCKFKIPQTSLSTLLCPKEVPRDPKVSASCKYSDTAVSRLLHAYNLHYLIGVWKKKSVTIGLTTPALTTLPIGRATIKMIFLLSPFFELWWLYKFLCLWCYQLNIN